MSLSIGNLPGQSDFSEMLDRVRNCQENNMDLNTWEDEFLDSIELQLLDGRTLTSKQIEKLEQIEVIVDTGDRGDGFNDMYDDRW